MKIGMFSILLTAETPTMRHANANAWHIVDAQLIFAQ